MFRKRNIQIIWMSNTKFFTNDILNIVVGLPKKEKKTNKGQISNFKCLSLMTVLTFNQICSFLPSRLTDEITLDDLPGKKEEETDEETQQKNNEEEEDDEEDEEDDEDEEEEEDGKSMGCFVFVLFLFYFNLF